MFSTGASGTETALKLSLCPGADLYLPPPRPLQERLDLWDKLKAKADAEVAAKEPQKITVTLPDGKQVEAQSWRTTPYDVAKGIRLVPEPARTHQLAFCDTLAVDMSAVREM